MIKGHHCNKPPLLVQVARDRAHYRTTPLAHLPSCWGQHAIELKRQAPCDLRFISLVDPPAVVPSRARRRVLW